MSPVQIGEVFSEVVAAPEPAATGAASPASQPAPWEQIEQMRALLAAAAIEADRTRSEGLDA